MSVDPTAVFETGYQALRSGCGVVELCNWSSVTVTGADRQKFLNSFCTNDVKRLKSGDSCEAFFTNVKGKISGYGIVSCREDELVIVGAPGQPPTLIEHLDRYIIREDVQLRDTTAERSYLLVAGGEAAKELHQSIELLPSIAVTTIPCNLVSSAYQAVVELSLIELPVVLNLIRTQEIVLAGLAFDAVRIEAGVPLFQVDFDESNFPQEVGRDRQAISFTKGCYLGQETVARIDALGHVNQGLVGVQFSGSDVPISGVELSRAGAVVGRVTSAAFSPELGAPLALAMVRRDANAFGVQLESSIGKCEVVLLPLQPAPRH